MATYIRLLLSIPSLVKLTKNFLSLSALMNKRISLTLLLKATKESLPKSVRFFFNPKRKA